MKKNLMYLYDPLCGWCYGMTVPLSSLPSDAGVSLEMLPTGLFSTGQPRLMDDEFAEFAWSNDQRVASLTGQIFSDRYKQLVLGNRQQYMDSGTATLALTAVSLTEPARELHVLKEIQHMRFVEGGDVTSVLVLIDILKKRGLNAAALMMENMEASLVEANHARIRLAETVQQTYAAYSVPMLIGDNGQKSWKVNTRELYVDPHALLNQFEVLESPSRALI